MKYIKYLILGIVFGIILTKAELISWYRIYEMFRFQAFHMYGVIGSAVGLGILGIWLIRKTNMKSINGDPIIFPDKDKSIARYLIGGTIFGLGWALAGACPGPMFILVGYGYLTFIVAILAALAGTYVYGALKDKLPH